MMILYIDSDSTSQNVATRANWLRQAGYGVETASGIGVPFSGYNLVIVNLGERDEQSDMREILANSTIAIEAQNAGVKLLFTGADKGDMLFAKTHRASYCDTYQLAQDTFRKAALEKATGVSSLGR